MTMWQNLDMHRKDAKATHGRVYKACGGKWHQELELREEPKRKAENDGKARRGRAKSRAQDPNDPPGTFVVKGVHSSGCSNKSLSDFGPYLLLPSVKWLTVVNVYQSSPKVKKLLPKQVVSRNTFIR